MSPVFIITLALLAAIAYTIYRKQRRRDYEPHYELRAPAPRALFGDAGADAEERRALDATYEPRALGPHGPVSDADARGAQADDAARRESETQRRAALLEHAARGDLDALTEARAAGGDALYVEVLGELVRWSEGSRERLDALAEFVCARESPRGSVELSRAYGRAWEESPDAATTARALHLAALSDDADELSRAFDVAVRLWREGKLPALSAEDLRALVEGEFWQLGAQSRASGAAFVLKQKIAALREELSARA